MHISLVEHFPVYNHSGKGNIEKIPTFLKGEMRHQLYIRIFDLCNTIYIIEEY